MLAGLPATDLQSLMLAVAARRSARRRPADLMRDYEQSRFLGASPLLWIDFAHWMKLTQDCVPSGRQQLADGGTVDWVSKLAATARSAR